LTTAATAVAQVVHDYGHRGVNNDFLVRSCDALALLYNDHSPHENHHLAASWGLLVEHDFLRSMPRAKRVSQDGSNRGLYLVVCRCVGCLWR
jgi:hypothetical protein